MRQLELSAARLADLAQRADKQQDVLLLKTELRELIRGYRDAQNLREWCRTHRVMLPF